MQRVLINVDKIYVLALKWELQSCQYMCKLKFKSLPSATYLKGSLLSKLK
jgi:hypothetical protein